MNANEREQALLLVHAYADGELDPAHAIDVERRIAADPVLARELARIEALRRVMVERLPRESSPGLPDRVRRAIGIVRDDSPERPTRFRPTYLRPTHLQPTWRAMAASVALTAMISGGGTWLVLRHPAGDPFVEAALAGHVRSLMAPQPVDVTSSDRHTVKPWFNGRLAQAPRVVDLSQDGFILVGGRIDVVDRKPVPTLVYRIRQHFISLTAVANASHESQSQNARTIQGYNLVGWVADDTAYWAVSDVARSDLEKFVQLFRAAAAEP